MLPIPMAAGAMKFHITTDPQQKAKIKKLHMALGRNLR
jgi:hypothetical protein